MRHLFTLLACGLLLTACISRPDYVIDEQRLTAVLIDVHMAEGLLDMQNTELRMSQDTTYQKEVMAAVLARHGLKKADYDTSLIWYSQNLSRLIKVYKRVEDSLQARHKYWQAVVGDHREFDISPAGDSVNLWTIDSYVVLDEGRRDHLRSWRIEADSNYVAGDSIVWSWGARPLDSLHVLVASLSLQLERGDSTWMRGASVVVRRDSAVQMAVAADAGALIRTIILTANMLPAVSDRIESNQPATDKTKATDIIKATDKVTDQTKATDKTNIADGSKGADESRTDSESYVSTLYDILLMRYHR